MKHMIEIMLHVRLIFYSIRAQTFEIIDDSPFLKKIDLIYHISPTQLPKICPSCVCGGRAWWMDIHCELGSLEFW